MEEETKERIKNILTGTKLVTLAVKESGGKVLEFVSEPFVFLNEEKLYCLVQNNSLLPATENAYYTIASLASDNRLIRTLQGTCSIKTVTGETLKEAFDAFETKFPERISKEAAYLDFQGSNPDKRFVEIKLTSQKYSETTTE